MQRLVIVMILMLAAATISGCAGIEARHNTRSAKNAPVMYFGMIKWAPGKKPVVAATSYGDNGKLVKTSGEYEFNAVEDVETLLDAETNPRRLPVGFTVENGKATLRKTSPQAVIGEIKAFDGSAVTVRVGAHELKFSLNSPYDTHITNSLVWPKNPDEQNHLADKNRKVIELRLSGAGAKDPAMFKVSGFTIVREVKWLTEADLQAEKDRLEQEKKERLEALKEAERLKKAQIEAEEAAEKVRRAELAAAAAAEVRNAGPKPWDGPAVRRAQP